MLEVSLTASLDQALRLADAQEARQQGEAWLKAAVQSGDHRMRSLGLCKVAEAFCSEKDFASAAEKVKAAKEIAEEQSLDDCLAVVKLQLARICAQPGGNADKALDLAEDAAQLFQRLQSRRGEAACALLLGDMYALLQDKDQAVRKHKEALAAFRQMGDTSAVGYLQLRIAQDHLAGPGSKAAAAAKAAAEKAVAAYQVTKEMRMEGSSWMVVAEAQGDMKDVASAKESIGKACDVFAELKETSLEVKALESLTQICLRNNLPAEAVKAAKGAVTACHKAGDHQGEARALLSLAELLLSFDGVGAARKVLAVAKNMMQELRMTEVKDCQQLEARCDHAEAVAEVERAIHRNRDFLHVPRVLVVDPGGRQRLQQEFADFAKAV